MNSERLETLVIARASVASRALTSIEIAKALRRFSSTTTPEVDWNEIIETTIDRLRARELLDEQLHASDPDELGRRIGTCTVKRWPQLADRVLPGLALGIAPQDAKSHAKLTGRDEWAAAIVGRVLGLWTTGAPPSLAAVCDALAWRELGLTGKPKRCPPEVRALFVQRRLASDPGPPDRQVRLLASREVDASRPELRALRDALVRGWLHDRRLERTSETSFASDVRVVARDARQGVFGDRKVFIAAAWDALRARPQWSQLTLDDFKARLLMAHRAGELSLARADLVAAMDPALVAASETATDSASFHFIVREASS